MLITGYKCQYCKEKFKTNDLEHERKCKKFYKTLETFNTKYLMIRSKLIKDCFNHLKKHEKFIDLLNQSHSIKEEIFNSRETSRLTGTYNHNNIHNLYKTHEIIEDKIILEVNTLIKSQIFLNFKDSNIFEYIRINKLEHLRKTILNKFEKIYLRELWNGKQTFKSTEKIGNKWRSV